MLARRDFAPLALLSWILPLALPSMSAPARAQDRPVRVGLYDGVGSFEFSAGEPAEILDASGHEVGAIAPRQAWVAQQDNESRVALIDGARRMVVNAPVRVIPQ
ncbi:MAG: hypothetical protein KGR26_04900, partial [Cyanobacteria bacterium REEB65]|nr:hypothetical protein [Cyanobacteria bacterium REEB65]